MWLTGKVQKTEELEVLDIDEERYRREELSTRLYGYLLVPREKTLTQNRKAPTPVSETASIEAIAYDIIEAMEPETRYPHRRGNHDQGNPHASFGSKEYSDRSRSDMRQKACGGRFVMGIRFCHILKEEEPN